MIVRVWRRLDMEGLERLEIRETAEGVAARGTIIVAGTAGMVLNHDWRLDPDWRLREVRVERRGWDGPEVLELARGADGWTVNGRRRADLDGAEEADFSYTPFCNSFVIRRLGAAPGSRRTLDTAFIDGEALAVQRSRQRYERLEDGRVRYTDLGVAKGFEAEIETDAAGFVRRYQHLFEALPA